MKEKRIELKDMVVSEGCRTYSYSVQDLKGDIRHFIVEISLKLFTNSLKFQDGPLITREKLITELTSELAGASASLRLQIDEVDILKYAEKHSPKSSTWKRYQQRPE